MKSNGFSSVMEIESWVKADFYDGLNIFLSIGQRFSATVRDTFCLKPVKYFDVGLKRRLSAVSEDWSSQYPYQLVHNFL